MYAFPAPVLKFTRPPLPNAPSAYSPDASPKLAKERQSQVVAAMVRNRKLSQEQANGILLSQL